MESSAAPRRAPRHYSSSCGGRLLPDPVLEQPPPPAGCSRPESGVTRRPSRLEPSSRTFTAAADFRSIVGQISGDAPAHISSGCGDRVLANDSSAQPACDRGCAEILSASWRPPPPEEMCATVSASAEAQREPKGGLGGCSPRRPSFGGRSRSAQGQGRRR